MISVFQIFRVLMGLIIFIFVLFFFLRISEMYTTTQLLGSKLEAISTFDYVAMITYTSGNPAIFPGFEDFETLVYEPPKIKSEAGQKTLSVPVFFIPGEGEISLDRRCLDFGWFRWCIVFALPDSSKILFTPLENTPATRELIRDVVSNLPGSLEFGFCNGGDARSAGRVEFLGYLDSETGVTYEPCRVGFPEHYRLVTVSASTGFPGNFTGNHIIITPGERLAYVGNSTEDLEPRPYEDGLDLAVFITGGHKALDYKNAVLSLELAAGTRIMKERSILLSQRFKENNVQPCLECSTPFPKACGWTDYMGQEYESDVYKDFISSIDDLLEAIPGRNYKGELDDTVLKYEELKNQGCE
jgi:hypothetical protein